MYRNHEDKQLNMFSSLEQISSGRAQKKLSDEDAWHNIFRKYYFDQIDEEPYKVLYSMNLGRPNQSVKVLLGMMLIKEYFGYTDAQLFDGCDLDLRIRSALGLYNLDENRPSDSTYYEFRAKVAMHLEDTGEDLIEISFNRSVTSQLKELDINGEKVRMDSKLIQSNIAKMNRLQLILESLRVVIKAHKGHIQVFSSLVTPDQYAILERLTEKSASNITYGLKKEDKEKLILEVGYIILAMISAGYVNSGDLLYKIYKEHYEEIDDHGDDTSEGNKLIDQSKIESGSIQSPHDEDAAYRKKGSGHTEQSIQGFHTNITETCDQDEKPNLITNVITTGANITEAEYLQPAIQGTQDRLGADKRIKEVITDGGYDSTNNKINFSKPEYPDLKLAKQKGKEKIYHMELDEQGELHVKDRKTGEPHEVRWSEKAEKYKIKQAGKQTRYLTSEQVIAYIQGQEIENRITKVDLGIRANAESTMHQAFCKLGKRSKIRYRGLIKSHWYVLMRALAVNLTRIGAKNSQIAIIFINIAKWCLIKPLMQNKNARTIYRNLSFNQKLAG